MTKILSPYQWAGVEFLSSRKFALLADDMGLGKTAQTVTAAVDILAVKILVICPAVARVNWKREFAMWSPWNDFQVCEGKDHYPTDRCIVSYDYATAHVERLTAMTWDLVINDESHFIKEPEAGRTRAIYGKNGIVRRTKRMWDLSGTPAPNHAGELWPMLYTFGITKLVYNDFVESYCRTKPTYYGGKPGYAISGTKTSKIAEIKKMLSEIMLRRLKEEVMKDLPPISYEEVVVEGGFVNVAFDKQTYENERKIVSDVLAMNHREDKILEALTDSVSTLRKVTGLQKVKSVAELVYQELLDKAYDKIVIFAVHREVIQQLKEHLAPFNPVTLNGATPPQIRQNNIDAFQNDPHCRVFLGNIKSAGTAITLTAACQVLFLELSWTPGDNAQAAMRCHRRGQLRPVFVRMAVLEDSLDQKVTSTLRRKTEELTQIFDQQLELDV